MKRLILILLAIAGFSSQARAAVAPPIDFNRDIRPIFSENCYACHGPDASKRKGDMRLDDKASAFIKAKSGKLPIISGDPGKVKSSGA